MKSIEPSFFRPAVNLKNPKTLTHSNPINDSPINKNSMKNYQIGRDYKFISISLEIFNGSHIFIKWTGSVQVSASGAERGERETIAFFERHYFKEIVHSQQGKTCLASC